jgi:2-polyprenyl-3-methyl-5-hydroxy-6-metoxy-1,4-benzoquinol methylase
MESDVNTMVGAQSFMQDQFSTAIRVWDSLLTQQVALFAPSEIDHLSSLSSWQSARTVIDIGCGNGDYVAALQRAFPWPKFHGIDSSPGLIEIARQRHHINGITFHTGDVTRQSPNLIADAIILRFVVQHLADPAAFFEHLRRHAHDRTMVVIIEPNFAKSSACPALARFSNLVARYEETCRARCNARTAVGDDQLLQSLYGGSWTLADTSTVVSRHQRAVWSEQDLSGVFEGWISSLETSGAVDANYGAVRSELAEWMACSGQSADIALTVRTLRPALRT